MIPCVHYKCSAQAVQVTKMVSIKTLSAHTSAIVTNCKRVSADSLKGNHFPQQSSQKSCCDFSCSVYYNHCQGFRFHSPYTCISNDMRL